MTKSNQTIIDGRYRILELLGQGVHGSAYKAEDANLQRNVAIKMLTDPRDQLSRIVETFTHESPIARLRHKNIVRVYSIGVHEGEVYVVAEYEEGRTLASVLATEGPLPVLTAMEIFCELAEAVAYAHRNQVMHCDLKPQNIMLIRSADGQLTPKLLDLGLSQAINSSDQQNVDGAWQSGAPGYMSPERCQGAAGDARSQVYELALDLYETITGKPAHPGTDSVAILHQAINVMPQPLRLACPEMIFPDQLEKLLFKALAKIPAQRFQTMDEFAEELKRFLDAWKKGYTLPYVGLDKVKVKAVEPKQTKSARGSVWRLLLFSALALLCGKALALLACICCSLLTH